MRVSEKKQKEELRRNRGLGALIRGRSASSSSSLDENAHDSRSAILSPSQIVGADPTANSSSSFLGKGAVNKGMLGINYSSSSLVNGNTICFLFLLSY
jgi:hypothetical protein